MFGSIRWRPALTSIEIVTAGFWARAARPSKSQIPRIAAAYRRVCTATMGHDSCLTTAALLSAVLWSQALPAVAPERGNDGIVHVRRFSPVRNLHIFKVGRDKGAHEHEAQEHDLPLVRQGRA